MAVCEFPFTPDCSDLLNWFVLLLGGILAFVFFLWQWNIRSLRRNFGQAKIVLNLIGLKEHLEKYETSINDFFDKKITVQDLMKIKDRRTYNTDQLNFAISISHDTMKSSIILKIDTITEYVSWETIDNRDNELEHNSDIIKLIDEVQEKYLKRQTKIAKKSLDDIRKKDKS